MTGASTAMVSDGVVAKQQELLLKLKSMDPDKKKALQGTQL